MPTASAVSDLRPLEEFNGARQSLSPKLRLEEVRRRAVRFREAFLETPQVVYYRSFGLIRVPFPTRYGFLNACTAPTPFVHILNRMIVTQFRSQGAIKTLLISPTDFRAAAETPFFKRLAQGFGPFESLGKQLIGPEIATVEACLAGIGLKPERVDYLSYDHLHTQDLRRWLGPDGYFPNAKLLVMREEWESAQALLPPQADWYCPGGLDGVDADRVVLLDDDVALGDGVALVRTPGHTAGNHSFVVNTPEGLLVTSENGISADNYAPHLSAIPGVRRYAAQTGMEVILNGNTQESAIEQYISMVQEKEMAGPSRRHPGFFNVVPSSELSAYWLFPGVAPTVSTGDLEFGRPVLA